MAEVLTPASDIVVGDWFTVDRLDGAGDGPVQVSAAAAFDANEDNGTPALVRLDVSDAASPAPRTSFLMYPPDTSVRRLEGPPAAE